MPPVYVTFVFVHAKGVDVSVLRTALVETLAAYPPLLGSLSASSGLGTSLHLTWIDDAAHRSLQL